MSNGLHINITALRQYAKEVINNGKGQNDGVSSADREFLKKLGIEDINYAENFVNMLTKVGLNTSQERSELYGKLNAIVEDLKRDGFSDSELQTLISGVMDNIHQNPKATLEDIVRELQKGIVRIQDSKGKLEGDAGKLKKVLANYINGENINKNTIKEIADLCEKCGYQVIRNDKGLQSTIEFEIDGKKYEFHSVKIIPQANARTELIEKEGIGLPEIEDIEFQEKKGTIGSGSWEANEITDAGIDLDIYERYFTQVYTTDSQAYYKFNEETLQEDFPGQDFITLDDLREAIEAKTQFEGEVLMLKMTYINMYTMVLQESNCPDETLSEIIKELGNELISYYKANGKEGLQEYLDAKFRELTQSRDIHVNPPELFNWLKSHPDGCEIESDSLQELKRICPNINITYGNFGSIKTVEFTDIAGVKHTYIAAFDIAADNEESTADTTLSGEILAIIQRFASGNCTWSELVEDLEAADCNNIKNNNEDDRSKGYDVSFTAPNGKVYHIVLKNIDAAIDGEGGKIVGTLTKEDLAGIDSRYINKFFDEVAWEGDNKRNGAFLYTIKDSVAAECGITQDMEPAEIIKLLKKHALIPTTEAEVNAIVYTLINGDTSQIEELRGRKGISVKFVKIDDDTYELTVKLGNKTLKYDIPVNESNRSYLEVQGAPIRQDILDILKLFTSGNKNWNNLLKDLEAAGCTDIQNLNAEDRTKGYDVRFTGPDGKEYHIILKNVSAAKEGDDTVVNIITADQYDDLKAYGLESCYEATAYSIDNGKKEIYLYAPNSSTWPSEVPFGDFDKLIEYGKRLEELKELEQYIQYNMIEWYAFEQNYAGFVPAPNDSERSAIIDALYDAAKSQITKGTDAMWKAFNEKLAELQARHKEKHSFMDAVTKPNGYNTGATVVKNNRMFRQCFEALVGESPSENMINAAKEILGDDPDLETTLKKAFDIAFDIVVEEFKEDTAVTIKEAIDRFLTLLAELLIAAKHSTSLSDEEQEFVNDVASRNGVKNKYNDTKIDEKDSYPQINAIINDNQFKEAVKNKVKEFLGDRYFAGSNFDGIYADALEQILEKYSDLDAAKNLTNKDVIDAFLKIIFQSIAGLKDDLNNTLNGIINQFIRGGMSVEEAIEALRAIGIELSEPPSEAGEAHNDGTKTRTTIEFFNFDGKGVCLVCENSAINDGVQRPTETLFSGADLVEAGFSDAEINRYFFPSLWIQGQGDGRHALQYSKRDWPSGVNTISELKAFIEKARTTLDTIIDDFIRGGMSVEEVTSALRAIGIELSREPYEAGEAHEDGTKTRTVVEFINFDGKGVCLVCENSAINDGVQSHTETLFSGADLVEAGFSDAEINRYFFPSLWIQGQGDGKHALQYSKRDWPSGVNTLSELKAYIKQKEEENAQENINVTTFNLNSITHNGENVYTNNGTISDDTIGKSAKDVAKEKIKTLLNQIRTQLINYIRSEYCINGFNMTDTEISVIIDNIIRELLTDGSDIMKKVNITGNDRHYSFNAKDVIDVFIEKFKEKVNNDNPNRAYTTAQINEAGLGSYKSSNYFIKDGDNYKLNLSFINNSVAEFKEFINKNGKITTLAQLKDAIDFAEFQAKKSAYESLANALPTNVNQLTKLGRESFDKNGYYNVEFGMTSFCKIAFEDTNTRTLYNALVDDIKEQFKASKNKAAFEQLGLTDSQIEQLVQSAWLMTYNTYKSGDLAKMSDFINKVLANLKQILTTLKDHPDYLYIYTTSTNYGNPQVQAQIPNAVNNNLFTYETNGMNGDIYHTDAEGILHIENDEVDPKYQTMMKSTLSVLTSKYCPPSDEETIKIILKDAQIAALNAANCGSRLDDCPYGTGKRETHNDDNGDGWSINFSDGMSNDANRGGDKGQISLQALLQLTLYYFDKFFLAHMSNQAYHIPEREQH